VHQKAQEEEIQSQESHQRPEGKPMSVRAKLRHAQVGAAQFVMVICAILALSGLVAQAADAAPIPWWHVTSGARPSYLAPEGKGQIVATVANLGEVSSSGDVTITDRLPAGLSATKITAVVLEGSASPSQKPVGCVLGTLTCTFAAGALQPYQEIEVRIAVAVSAGATICTPNSPSCERNEVSASGGGAPEALISRPVTVSELPAPFGVEAYEVTPEEAGGAPVTQAGSHPFQVTGTLTLNELAATSSINAPATSIEAHPVAFVKDLAGLLPPGLIGNPTPFPTCTLSAFMAAESCPARSVIGVAIITYNEPLVGDGLVTTRAPIVNLEPAHGEPARFGILPTEATPVFLDAHVRTSGDYGITLSSSNITQLVGFLAYKLTFWGVPGDPRHDSTRGNVCLHGEACAPLGEINPPPFLAMPTSCVGPLRTSTEADSWVEPQPEGGRALFAETEPMPAMTGCNQLPFEPQIRVSADGSEASAATGLTVDVHVPQESILNGRDLAQSAVRGITVALPEGVAVNPAGGDGLEACSESLVGFQGFKEFETNPGVTSAAFSPTLPEPSCPTASKIGTVEIATPLLPPGQRLKGAVYLASQNENPFGSLIALYLVAEDPISGTLVRLPGETRLSETGQIVAFFKNNPQLAFEDAELHFFGGERAPLATPARCGAYTTNASFVPWSAEPWDEAALTTQASSTFTIASGPHGAPCPGPSLPFSPSLTGGTTNINAGAFSPLTTTIARADGQQNLQTVQLHMPPGLTGVLAGVKLCPEAQANEGACGPESLIGETTVSAGVGSDPVSVKGGRVYLTEAYAGAPFGLSIVNPVKAGPFDLEHDTSSPGNQPPCDCVVVRAKIEVDPRSAALTITTDASGPHAIPHLIDGIPVQIKAVNVTITRPGFTVNPTNCDAQSLTGVIAADEGGSSPVSVPFQVTNCATLKFTPTVAIAIAAHASKADGASLDFKIAYPKGALGTQSWFDEAKFDIPRQLPARLTTLQQACLASTFESNRAACPAASKIGTAIVRTPVLPVPLTGPVYFVSYGGAKFPDAVLVLDGYGVHIELHGETFIDSKTGVTSATFRDTPDVPFESIEVSVPTGPFSEFGVNLPAKADYDFCGQKLTMPTLFKAQNGLEIHQSTAVQITGCPMAHKAKKKKKHTKKAKKRKRA
jgi:hypothetical protein